MYNILLDSIGSALVNDKLYKYLNCVQILKEQNHDYPGLERTADQRYDGLSGK